MSYDSTNISTTNKNRKSSYISQNISSDSKGDISFANNKDLAEKQNLDAISEIDKIIEKEYQVILERDNHSKMIVAPENF